MVCSGFLKFRWYAFLSPDLRLWPTLLLARVVCALWASYGHS